MVSVDGPARARGGEGRPRPRGPLPAPFAPQDPLLARVRAPTLLRGARVSHTDRVPRHPDPNGTTMKLRTATLALLASAATLATASALDPSTNDPLQPQPVVNVDDEEEDEGPTKEEVEAAVERLEEALDSDDFEVRVAALVEAREVQHDDVAKEVAKAVKDKAKEVRLAAVTSLGYLRVPYSLTTLHKWSKKKSMLEDTTFAKEMFKAIGRHQNKKSLKYLEDGAVNAPRDEFEARVLAMGKIPHMDAVEEIVSIMNKLRANEGGRGRRDEREENVKNMDVIQLALNHLTGADEGTDRRAWQKWWNNNKRDIEIDPDAMPLMVRNLENKWRSYWNEPRERERGERDEGRGR